MMSCSAGDERWHCTFTNGRFDGDADTTAEKGGSGAGFRPHELLEAALASCLNISIRMAAADAGIDLGDVTTTVDLQRDPHRSTFGYAVDFENVTEAEAERLRAAVVRCPVWETVSKEIVVEDLGDTVDPVTGRDSD